MLRLRDLPRCHRVSCLPPRPGFSATSGPKHDTPERFEADIMAKSKGKSAASLARLATQTIGPALEWLADAHGLEWIVLDDFLYPGHSRHRMHAVPEKTGAGLEARLLAAVESAEIPVVTGAHVTTLYVDEGNKISAVGDRAGRTGAARSWHAELLMLACNGLWRESRLVRRISPEMADAPLLRSCRQYGRRGASGAKRSKRADLVDLSAYQGHGSLAHPHGVLISWALMMEGSDPGQFRKANAFPTNMAAIPSRPSTCWRKPAASPGTSTTRASTSSRARAFPTTGRHGKPRM
jgi:fumarate reductase flavoprotein subunit